MVLPRSTGWADGATDSTQMALVPIKLLPGSAGSVRLICTLVLADERIRKKSLVRQGKDLGVTADSSMEASAQCAAEVKKATRMLGCIGNRVGKNTKSLSTCGN